MRDPSASQVPQLLTGTTADNTLEWLRRAIVARELRPGQRILQEDLANELGVSIGPVREALRVLEQEGQVTYRPRRGYFVTELSIADLREIYELRQILEERAARAALPWLDEEALNRIASAASECAGAARAGDVALELDANRRFHMAIVGAPGLNHTIQVIRLLWDRTEAYRAIYYNSSAEREAAIEAHDRIIAAVIAGDADELVRQLDAHRHRALSVLEQILDEAPEDVS
jgi:DNA-binding GntR family transcriptional regulator